MDGLQLITPFIQKIFSRVFGISSLPVAFQSILYLHKLNLKK